MSEIWGIPSSYKPGPKNHLFRRLRKLMATLMAYVFGTKHDVDNWASALITTRGFLHRLEKIRTLVHKQLKIGSAFYLPYATSAFYFMARLRRRTSANGTTSNSAKLWTVHRANSLSLKSWDRFSQKWGDKTFTTWPNGEYLRKRNVTKTIGQGRWKARGSPTLSQNCTNFGPQTGKNRAGVFAHPA